jgi:hypothetical protein
MSLLQEYSLIHYAASKLPTHRTAIRLSAQQNTACIIMDVRESSITIGVSIGDFILKQLHLDQPTNLQNQDIPIVFL